MTPRLVQRVLHRIRHTATGDGGFTLMEAVVSFVLFVIVAAAATAAVANGIKVSGTSTNRVTATSLAQKALAQARANQSALISTPNSTTVTGVYTLTVNAVPPTNTAGELCPAGSTIPVTVTVTWTGGGNRGVRMDSVIAC